MLLSNWSQDRAAFHNVFCFVWGGLAEVAGVVGGVVECGFSVRAVGGVHSGGVQGEHDQTWRVVVYVMDGWGFTAQDTVWT